MDLGLSFSLLCLVWPLMILVTVLIKLESKGPALYKQMRTGFKGRPFEVLKFRSMRQDAEADGAVWAKENDNRVTRIGKWIRLTRIDELPQLFNVFRGEMSFIGPRPERPEFDQMLEKEIPYYSMRYLVRPGITGWAQVMYPYGASVEDAKQKLEYDLYYIKNHRFWLDFIIVLRTVKIVLFRKGR
jgi:exopolysaccharide biosynthesis polyprenyl glycosylphosphotransferase